MTKVEVTIDDIKYELVPKYGRSACRKCALYDHCHADHKHPPAFGSARKKVAICTTLGGMFKYADYDTVEIDGVEYYKLPEGYELACDGCAFYNKPAAGCNIAEHAARYICEDDRCIFKKARKGK